MCITGYFKVNNIHKQFLGYVLKSCIISTTPDATEFKNNIITVSSTSATIIIPTVSLFVGIDKYCLQYATLEFNIAYIKVKTDFVVHMSAL